MGFHLSTYTQKTPIRFAIEKEAEHVYLLRVNRYLAALLVVLFAFSGTGQSNVRAGLMERWPPMYRMP
jgi:hypothetical protein